MTDIVHTNFATFVFMQRLTALICCYDKSQVLGCTTISGTFCNRDFQGMVTLQTCLIPCQISLASQLHSIPQRADTESDRCCGTEWGWLARLLSNEDRNSIFELQATKFHFTTARVVESHFG